MLGYIPKWKVTDREMLIREVMLGEIKELVEGANGLIIERMVDKKEE